MSCTNTTPAAVPVAGAGTWSLRSLFALWRSRRALTALDDRGLDDVGLSASAAQREAKRPMWDVPSNWRL